MNVLTALGAFAGAALGSVLAYRATLRATGVEREARRREEWGRRFTAAITAVTGSEPTRVAAGHALLLELIQSELATEGDRRQARAVLEVFATQRGDVDLRLVAPNDLNEAEIVEETGVDEQTEEGGR